MLLEQREECFYEYCDAFGTLDDTIYITESEEGLFTRIKKFFQDMIKKIHDFLFGEKVKGLNMKERVKMPEGSKKKTNGFIAAFKKFASKVKAFISGHKGVIAASTLAVLTTFSVAEFKRRKNGKEKFETCNRKELKEMIGNLEKASTTIEACLESGEIDTVTVQSTKTGRGGFLAINRNISPKEKIQEFRKWKNDLKDASSTTRTALSTVLKIGNIAQNVCTWLGNVMSGPAYALGKVNKTIDEAEKLGRRIKGK